MTSRWWAAWILFITLILLLLFYLVWLPLSYYGKIVEEQEPQAEALRLSEAAPPPSQLPQPKFLTSKGWQDSVEPGMGSPKTQMVVLNPVSNVHGEETSANPMML